MFIVEVKRMSELRSNYEEAEKESSPIPVTKSWLIWY